MSKRISKEFPNLGVNYGDGKPVVKSKRTPGGSGRRGAVDSGKTSGTDINAGGKSRRLPRLEASDKAKMQKFGLDPDDKNAVKHWLRSKKEAADQEARESESY